MSFGYNPQIILYHFFRKLNLAIFQAFLLSKRIDSGYLVCTTPPTVLCQFFGNFTGILVIVGGLWIRYYPQIIFVTFSAI